jgi:hypothetical protein
VSAAGVVLPRRVLRQPSPPLNPGGDCGPCCLGGLVGLSVPAVYAELADDKVTGMSYAAMRQALWKAHGAGLLDRLIDDHPLWIAGRYEAHLTWGVPSWTQNLAWFHYVRMALEAGYYALAQVVHSRGGAAYAPDHWIMLVGAREQRREFEGGASFEHEVLVSCSSTSTPDEEWVLERDFLRNRGGFNVFLARPA